MTTIRHPQSRCTKHLPGALVMLCLALAPTAALPDTAAPPPAGVADLLPGGAYGAALAAALENASDIDFAALRGAYAADPGYSGRSRLADRAISAFVTEESSPPWTEDDVLRAVMADFPLLDTHVAAFGHYKSSSLPNRQDMMGAHAGFYQDILKAVLATERQTDGIRTFTVLSIGEQRSVIEALDLGAKGNQALLNIGGVPHDRIDTAKGPILFDISAFFGK